ncbi:hypothetical protein BT96DRAFT_661164 [Gymnopus androsaceus JB14]|uniref:Uncharacterized protein n=1 Tax=Gymnopus androsaceus JB14 TaxID=1447944 RepID=A0A6A4GFP6_9AGAR|nr:hypothetical protein BT96DRAFT_661164 [Gymnopus androsaceus JB14]
MTCLWTVCPNLWNEWNAVLPRPWSTMTKAVDLRAREIRAYQRLARAKVRSHA